MEGVSNISMSYLNYFLVKKLFKVLNYFRFYSLQPTCKLQLLRQFLIRNISIRKNLRLQYVVPVANGSLNDISS